jgi:hypothetical protein
VAGAVLDTHAMAASLDIKHATSTPLLRRLINTIDQFGVDACDTADTNKAGFGVIFAGSTFLGGSLLTKNTTLSKRIIMIPM